MTHIGPSVVTVAAKLPSTLAASLNELAAVHGLSRSAVIRELIAGAVDEGRFPTEDERAGRSAQIANARIRQHVQRVHDHAGASRHGRATYGLADLLRISVDSRLGRLNGQ